MIRYSKHIQCHRRPSLQFCCVSYFAQMSFGRIQTVPLYCLHCAPEGDERAKLRAHLKTTISLTHSPGRILQIS